MRWVRRPSFGPMVCWAAGVSLSATLCSSATAQLIGGYFNGRVVTQDGDDFPILEAEGGGYRVAPFPDSGESSISLTVPPDTVSGRIDAGGFLFFPGGGMSLAAAAGKITFTSESSVTLSTSVPTFEGAFHYPSVSVTSNEMRVSDTVEIFPDDPALFGQRVRFDIAFELSGSLSTSLGSSAQADARARVTYSFTTSGEPFEGAIDARRQAGATTVETEGEANFSSPVSVVSAGGLAVLGPTDPDLGPTTVPLVFEIETSVSGGGAAGSTFGAAANLQIQNLRIQNVRTASDEPPVPVPLDQLTSRSGSGYDWIGNGPPDPEPEDGVRWVNPLGGSFATGVNWDTGEAPDTEATAVVDLPGTYAINVGIQAVGRLLAGGDPSFNVEFGNAGLTVGSTSLDPAGVDIDLGTARFTGGTIRTVHARTGRSAATTVEIDGTETTWNNTGRFTAGKGGETEVRVINGGHLTSGETFVGDGATVTPASARLEARGFGSKIAAGNAQVGIGSHGDLYAYDGGEITGGEVRLAINPGVIGRLASVGRGSGAADATSVEVSYLVAGYGGDAFVFVEDGGELNARSMVVGQKGSGTVFVKGSGSVLRAPFSLDVGGLLEFTVEVENSADAFGDLVVSEGGKVVAGEALLGELGVSLGMNIGTVAAGSVMVDGEAGATRPELVVYGGLRVGSDGNREGLENDNGSLSVANGGLVRADEVTVAVKEGADGTVEVRGENAGRDDVSELRVSEDLEIGGYRFLSPSDGLGRLVATGGARVAVDGAIYLGNSNGGEMEISGTRASDTDEPTAVTANIIRVGRHRPGHITVRDLATLEALTMGLGAPGEVAIEGARSEGTLEIVDGGQVEVGDLLLNVGSEPGARGTAIVTGWTDPTSSTLRAESIVVGPDSELQVLDRGQVRVGALTVEGGGAVFVEGGDAALRSRVIVSGDLTMGGSFGNESFLGVDGDAVVAVEGNVVYTTGAAMCIDGSLVTDQVFAAGFLELGCSLGAATIDGDFTLAPTGVLEVEVQGEAPVTEHDTMIVTGDVDLQGTVRIVFSGYAPSEGDQILFLDVGGEFSAIGLKTHVVGLKPGFEAAFERVGEMVALRALNDGELLAPDDPVEVFDPRGGGAGGFGFSFLALEGTDYRIDRTTDLRSWSEVDRVAGTGEILRYQRSAGAGDPAAEAFFRVAPVTAAAGE